MSTENEPGSPLNPARSGVSVPSPKRACGAIVS